MRRPLGLALDAQAVELARQNLDDGVLLDLYGPLLVLTIMPVAVQTIMQIAPTVHFARLGSAILFRGAGIDVVWPQLLALAVIGAALFAFSLARFRKTIAQMA